MEFKAKLNSKFYVVSLLLLGAVALAGYGVLRLNMNEILLKDGEPMGREIKMLISAVIGAVALSWTVSFFAMVRQMLLGCAFRMNDDGIAMTLTAVRAGAFILVMPVRNIPYSAIKKVSDENGTFVLHIDKSKLDMLPVFRTFASGRYTLFAGFTVNERDEIKAELEKRMQ